MLSLLLLACNHHAGEPFAVDAVVVEAGGGTVLLEHGKVQGFLEAGRTPFVADPNLSRQMAPGDIVHVNLLRTEQNTRVIGFEVTGKASSLEPGAARPLGIGEALPAVDVPTSSGPVRIGPGQEGVWVVTFLFTSCPKAEYCPLLARKLGQLQPLIKGKGRILAITLDPAGDSLEALDRYGTLRMADPEVWRFGRLELAPLTELLVAAGMSREEGAQTILHNLRILVVDREGKVSWKGDDNSWDPQVVAEAVASAR